MRGWLAMVVVTTGCGRVGFDEAARLDDVAPDTDPAVAQAYVNEILADNPIAYYRLESSTTAEDSSTFGRHAGLNGGVALAPGVIGNGVRFSGGGGGFGLGMGGELAPPVAFLFNGRAPFTYECWLQPDILDGTWRQLTQSDNWDGMGRRQGYTIEYRDDLISVDRRRDDLDEFAVSTGRLAAGTWVHIVATYDGATLALYLDGALRDSLPSTIMIASAAGTTSTISDPLYTVTGVLDECAIYDSALTAVRVQAHYDAAKP